MRITESYLRNVIRTTLKGVLKEAITQLDLNTDVIDPLKQLKSQIPDSKQTEHDDLIKKIESLIPYINDVIRHPTSELVLNKLKTKLNGQKDFEAGIINLFSDYKNSIERTLGSDPRSTSQQSLPLIRKLREIEGNLGLISTQFRTFQTKK